MRGPLERTNKSRIFDFSQMNLLCVKLLFCYYALNLVQSLPTSIKNDLAKSSTDDLSFQFNHASEPNALPGQEQSKKRVLFGSRNS